MIQIFKTIVPEQLDLSTKLLKTFDHPLVKGEEFFLFKKLDYIIILSQKLILPKLFGKTKRITNQIEVPFNAISWIVDTIENKFIKSPQKGGLPNNIRLYKESVEGEELQISCIDTTKKNNPKGYVLSNFSRNHHSSKKSIQEIPFPDELLFQNGLMDYLKSLTTMIPVKNVE